MHGQEVKSAWRESHHNVRMSEQNICEHKMFHANCDEVMNENDFCDNGMIWWLMIHQNVGELGSLAWNYWTMSVTRRSAVKWPSSLAWKLNKPAAVKWSESNPTTTFEYKRNRAEPAITILQCSTSHTEKSLTIICHQRQHSVFSMRWIKSNRSHLAMP